MPRAYKLVIEEKPLWECVNDFFKKLLRAKVLDLILLPQDVPTGMSVLQTLVRCEEDVVHANPFVPLLLMNSASLVSQLTVDSPKERIGAVMRSCEIRAAIELAKLKQIHVDNLVIIGVDCLGTYESRVFREIAEKNTTTQKLTEEFLSGSSEGKANLIQGKDVRLACQTCEYPTCENADIGIHILGCDTRREIIVQIADKLDGLEPDTLGLVAADDISSWENAVQVCRESRAKARDVLMQEVLAQTKDVSGFIQELEQCRRCYNCRKECPICYCRECIFDSRTFEHDSKQYFNWAEKKGKIRMPTDTLLFHLTRMQHMVISCVACGQCSSACPNNVPVAKFFKTIGSKVQDVFDYKAGRSIEEEIPQATFKEDEFPEVGSSSGKKT